MNLLIYFFVDPSTDPGSTFINPNTGLFSNPTWISISKTDYLNRNLSGWLATWGSSTNPIEGSLNVVYRDDQTKFSFFNITAVSGYANHFTVWVTNTANANVGTPTYGIYEVSFTRTGDSGYSGYSGTSGFSGYSGFSGSGVSGYSGYIGLSGYSGYIGLSGYSAYSGLSGYSGFSGLSGYSAYSGVSGSSGYSGFSGLSGYSAYSGLSGYSAYSGRSGYSGFSGFSGYKGLGANTTLYEFTDSLVLNPSDDPGGTFFTTSTGNLTSPSWIVINKTDYLNRNLSGWLATWGASTNPIEGSLNFVNRFDQTKFSFFNITAVSGYTNHFAVWLQTRRTVVHQLMIYMK
jgi:hypothetical protein